MDILSNIENRQYVKFETMFMSERSEDLVKVLENASKDQVVSILDSYEQMVHEINPDIIRVKDCIELSIKGGIIETDLYDINNPYRELAAVAIDTIESVLFDILPEPEVDNISDNDELSKICGETYYELEDALTDLFKEAKL